METLWFCLLTFMLAMYFVLDGFDLGVGAVHLWLARTPGQRGVLIRSIGPVWDGNEVWLIAAGGTMYFAFPALYASAFSGFYLPLMMVLWLLMLRGLSIELRGHVDNPLWVQFWDVVFSGSSLLLIVLFGAALGNVLRGAPLDADGWFFLPLWTNLQPGEQPGVLDWYTIAVGGWAVAVLVLHGALWAAVKTQGALFDKAVALAKTSWWAAAGSTVATLGLTAWVQPHVRSRFAQHPWALVIPFAALILCYIALKHGRAVTAFLASCGFVFFMIALAAFGLYPLALPSTMHPGEALTVSGAAAANAGLRIGLGWWVPGMILVVGYFVFVYRSFAGKVSCFPESPLEPLPDGQANPKISGSSLNSR